MPRQIDRAAMTRYHRKAEALKAERHAALDRIPDLIKRFIDKELTLNEYMSEYRKIKGTVSRCQKQELKYCGKALLYSGF